MQLPIFLWAMWPCYLILLMSTTPPTKPRANQGNFFKRSPLMSALLLLVMLSLLVISIVYLLSQYKPKPADEPKPVSDNLQVQPLEPVSLETLNDDNVANPDAQTDEPPTDADNQSDKPLTVQDRPSDGSIETTAQAATPAQADTAAKPAQKQSTNKAAASTPVSADDLYLPSRQNTTATAASTEIYDTQAAQQADAIDEQLSIAINQVRRLNEEKLAKALESQPQSQTPPVEEASTDNP